MNVSIKDLCFFRNKRPILQNIDAEFADGSITAITGSNGSGKSTLLKLVAGLLRPASGAITFDGQNINTLSAGSLAQKRAILLQNPYAPPEMSVFELMKLARFALNGNRKYDRQAIDRALSDAVCADLTGRKTGTLSGGELRKVFLAMALAQEPELLLLDEVEAGMDAAFCGQLPKFLHKLVAERRLTVIMVMHDLDLALHCATDILGIAGNKIGLSVKNSADAIEELNNFFHGTMSISPEHDGSIGAKLNYLK